MSSLVVAVDECITSDSGQANDYGRDEVKTGKRIIRRKGFVIKDGGTIMWVYRGRLHLLRSTATQATNPVLAAERAAKAIMDAKHYR